MSCLALESFFNDLLKLLSPLTHASTNFPYAALLAFLLTITPGNCTSSAGVSPFWP